MKSKNYPSKDLLNLGFANGWRSAPEIVKECRKKSHSLKWEQSQRRGISYYWCNRCGYIYYVDSSG